MKTVLVFGTFDGLHPGHRFFLAEAKRLGDRLVVVVAPDASVRALKQREPRSGEEQRREAVVAVDGVDEAIIGDAELGTYAVLTRVRPDLIALGHDQTALAEDLMRWMRSSGWNTDLVILSEYVGQAGKTD